jgi:hypothetical protein
MIAIRLPLDNPAAAESLRLLPRPPRLPAPPSGSVRTFNGLGFDTPARIRKPFSVSSLMTLFLPSHPGPAVMTLRTPAQDQIAHRSKLTLLLREIDPNGASEVDPEAEIPT